MTRPDQRIQSTIRNKIWRLNHLYSIVDKNSNRVIFRQNEIQKRISLCPELRKIILKARQFGVSTNELIDMFDDVIFNKNFTACILAHEQDAIKKLFRIIQRAYRYLDQDLKPVIDRGGGSRYEMYFPKLNSRIYCDLESRGDTINRLHISEAAFIKEPDRIKATLQAVPMNGKVTFESTANGMGNYFHDLWGDLSQSHLAKLFFPWFIFPDYRIETDPLLLTEEEKECIQKVYTHFGVELTHAQIAFRRFKQKELGTLFLQEYPEDDQTCFLSSGSSAINLFKVKEQIEKRVKPIEEQSGLRIFKRFDKTRRYVCGVDTAEGVEGDYSVATVFDARSREQVAILRRNDLKPHEFADKVYELCGRYTSGGRPWPLLAVERNNHGHAVLLQLQVHLRYPNLFFRLITESPYQRDDSPGWVNDKVTRPIMIDTFIDAVENRSIILNDIDTLGECLTLVNEDGKIQAAQGKHDDCIMASGIATQMIIECATLEIYDHKKILV